MTEYDATADLDLERRLRLIARDPVPQLPASVDRYLGHVVRGEDEIPSPKPLRPTIRPHMRAPRLAAASGIAAALVLALVGTLLVSPRRPAAASASPGSSDVWTALEWHDITATAFPLVDATPSKSRYAIWTVAGLHGRSYANAGDTVWASADGSVWTPVTGAPNLEDLRATRDWLFGWGMVPDNQPCHVDGKETTCTSRTALWYSIDGATWREAQIPALLSGDGAVTLMAVSGQRALVLVGPNVTSYADKAIQTAEFYVSSDGATWQEASIPEDLATALPIWDQVSASRAGFFVHGFVPDPNGDDSISGTNDQGRYTLKGSYHMWFSADGLSWAPYERQQVDAGLTILSGQLGDASPGDRVHSFEGMTWTRDETNVYRVCPPRDTVRQSSNGSEIIWQSDEPEFCVSLGDGNWRRLASLGESLPAQGSGGSVAIAGGVLYVANGKLYFGKAILGPAVEPTATESEPAVSSQSPSISPGPSAEPLPTDTVAPSMTPGNNTIQYTKLTHPPFGGAVAGLGPIRTLAIPQGVLMVGLVDDRVRASMSADGVSWSDISQDFGPATYGEPAVCRSQLLILTGSEATVWSSSDGKAWSSHAIGGTMSPESQAIAGNASGAGVIAGGALWWSSDCSTWKQIDLPAVGGKKTTPVAIGAYKDKMVVLAAFSVGAMEGPGAVFVTSDGVTWSSATTALPLIQLWPVSNGIMASEAANVGGGFWTSTDGLHWSHVSASPIYPCLGWDSDGTVLVIVQEDKTVLVSSDGVTWTAASGGAMPSPQRFAVLSRGLLVFASNGVYFGSPVTLPH